GHELAPRRCCAGALRDSSCGSSNRACLAGSLRPWLGGRVPCPSQAIALERIPALTVCTREWQGRTMGWVRLVALAACGASALVVAGSASAARRLTLGGGDGFFVSGTQIVCIVVDGTRPPLRALLCALADRGTHKALV